MGRPYSEDFGSAVDIGDFGGEVEARCGAAVTDITLGALVARLSDERGVAAGTSWIQATLKRCGLSGGKRPRMLASRTARTSALRERRGRDPDRSAPRPPERHRRNRSRHPNGVLRGWGRKGARCRAPLPQGRGKTTTFTAGVRTRWRRGDPRARAARRPRLTSTPSWDAVLVPELKPGDIVVVDHLHPHKAPGVDAAIAAAGAERLFPAPDSPAFNPIEQAFPKRKAHPRKAAARTRDDLSASIALAIETCTPKHRQNVSAHCRYDSD